MGLVVPVKISWLEFFMILSNLTEEKTYFVWTDVISKLMLFQEKKLRETDRTLWRLETNIKPFDKIKQLNKKVRETCNIDIDIIEISGEGRNRHYKAIIHDISFEKRKGKSQRQSKPLFSIINQMEDTINTLIEENRHLEALELTNEALEIVSPQIQIKFEKLQHYNALVSMLPLSLKEYDTKPIDLDYKSRCFKYIDNSEIYISLLKEYIKLEKIKYSLADYGPKPRGEVTKITYKDKDGISQEYKEKTQEEKIDEAIKQLNFLCVGLANILIAFEEFDRALKILSMMDDAGPHIDGALHYKAVIYSLTKNKQQCVDCLVKLKNLDESAYEKAINDPRLKQWPELSTLVDS